MSDAAAISAADRAIGQALLRQGLRIETNAYSENGAYALLLQVDGATLRTLGLMQGEGAEARFSALAERLDSTFRGTDTYTLDLEKVQHLAGIGYYTLAQLDRESSADRQHDYSLMA